MSLDKVKKQFQNFITQVTTHDGYDYEFIPMLESALDGANSLLEQYRLVNDAVELAQLTDIPYPIKNLLRELREQFAQQAGSLVIKAGTFH